MAGVKPWLANGKRADRVTFERGIPAHMMGIDGTWRRDCRMEDVSETGAKLTVEARSKVCTSRSFFPAAVVDGAGLPPLRTVLGQWRQIGVNFLKQGDKKKKAAARRAAQESLNAGPLRSDPSHNRHLEPLWRRHPCPGRLAVV